MNVEITDATLDDLEALLPLIAGYRTFYCQERDADRERQLFEGNIEHGLSTIFIARVADQVAAFAQLFVTVSTVRLGPTLILEDLFVEPWARRCGVATRMLVHAVAYAKRLGAKGMFLETAIGNAPAQALYRRLGWTLEGEFLKFNAPL